jgi:hypothetical protein
MYLITSDIEATRAELMNRGVDVSEPFHFGPKGQASGLNPERADYNSFVSFSNPDNARRDGDGIDQQISTLVEVR